MKDIVISERKIKEWRRTKSRLEAEIREKQEELDLINQRLEAIRLFSPNDTGEPENEKNITAQRQETAIADLSVPVAIQRVLRDSAKTLTPKEIRQNLEKIGYPAEKLGTSGAYLYTVLKRLRGNGVVVQEEQRYRLKRE